jgi:biotin transport system ATP-binding protein
VCDEPTTLLDLPNTCRVLGLIDDLPQQVVVITHDLDSVAGYDRVLVFDDGRLVADDEPGPAVAFYRALVT